MPKKQVNNIEKAARLRCELYIEQFGKIDILGIAGNTLDLAARIPRTLLSDEAQERKQDRRELPDGTGFETKPGNSPEPESQLAASLRPGQRRRIFVTGDGGTGKSEFINHLVYTLARKFVDADHESKALVPLWVDLAGFAKCEDLLGGFVHDRLPLDVATQLIDAGRLVLILDGLDEKSDNWKSIDGVDEFDGKFAALLNGLRLKSCPVVVAGRESALGSQLRCSLEPRNRLRLEPLTLNQEEEYIRKYFKKLGWPARGDELVAAVRKSPSTIQILLDRPFMLAVTCQAFDDPRRRIELPYNPAPLFHTCIMALLRRRLDTARIDISPRDAFAALSELAAASCERGFNITSERLTKSQNEVLKRLDPACGIILSSAGGTGKQYQFSNRAVAEYLAADWIVRHGRHGTCYESDVEIERSICEFYSDYVWSIEKRELLRWLVHGLWEVNRKLAICIGHWLMRHLEQSEHDHSREWQTRVSQFERETLGLPWRDLRSDGDDLHCTLLSKLLDLVVTMQNGADNGTENQPNVSRLYTQARSLGAFLTRMIQPTAYLNWYQVIDIRELAALPIELSQYYRIAFMAFLETLCKARQKNPYLVERVSEALADGWPGAKNVALRNDLIAMLKRLCNNPQENIDVIGPVAKTLAKSWAGAENASIRDELSELLKNLCKTPQKISNTIRSIARALAQGWPGAENTSVRDILVELLKKLCATPEKNWYAIQGVSRALAEGWPGAENTSVREILIELLKGLCESPLGNRDAISGFAEVLVQGWAGEENASLRDELIQLLKRLCNDAQLNNSVVGYIAEALAIGWPGKENALIRDELSELLKTLCKAPQKIGNTISSIARALAQGWPGAENTSVRDILIELLKKLCTTPQENETTIEWIAHTLVKGWPGVENASIGEELIKLLRQLCQYPLGTWSFFNSIASALTRGWPGKENISIRDELIELLDKLCSAPQVDEGAVGILVHGLKQGWPDANIASVRNNLLELIKALCESPEGNWEGIELIGNALVWYWPIAEIASVRDDLIRSLKILWTAPQKNRYGIDSIAYILATGWSRVEDPLVRDVLVELLKVQLRAQKANTFGFGVVPSALAKGWRGEKNTLVRRELIELLRTLCELSNKNRDEIDDEISSIASSVCECWPGSVDVAKLFLELGRRDLLESEDYVVIKGSIKNLEARARSCNWCHERISGFALESLSGVLGARGEKTPEAFIVAPREKLRPGLDWSLLPKEKAAPRAATEAEKREVVDILRDLCRHGVAMINGDGRRFEMRQGQALEAISRLAQFFHDKRWTGAPATSTIAVLQARFTATGASQSITPARNWEDLWFRVNNPIQEPGAALLKSEADRLRKSIESFRKAFGLLGSPGHVRGKAAGEKGVGPTAKASLNDEQLIFLNLRFNAKKGTRVRGQQRRGRIGEKIESRDRSENVDVDDDAFG